MDDDFGFESSVWATSNTDETTQNTSGHLPETGLNLLASSSKSPLAQAVFDDPDPFDDNDDFNFGATTKDLANTGGDDDDFGDFGDFDEGGGGASLGTFAQDDAFGDAVGFQQDEGLDWNALHLDPLPSTSKLKDDVDRILRPLWQQVDASVALSNEDIRQVGGINQILVTHQSRSLYTTLFQTSPPSTQPANWTRSRIRRRHLVSLGIPVNLDEMLPQSSAKPLPALQITTRPMSAPPGPRNASNPRIDRIASPPPGGASSASNSRAATPVQGRSPLARNGVAAATQAGLGPKPVLDEAQIEKMLAFTQDDLTLLPLPTLETHLASLRGLTANASAVLTHLLQTRDALQQDSETYNGLIAELVGEAQKIKPGSKSRTGQGRRATGNM